MESTNFPCLDRNMNDVHVMNDVMDGRYSLWIEISISIDRKDKGRAPAE